VFLGAFGGFGRLPRGAEYCPESGDIARLSGAHVKVLCFPECAHAFSAQIESSSLFHEIAAFWMMKTNRFISGIGLRLFLVFHRAEYPARAVTRRFFA